MAYKRSNIIPKAPLARILMKHGAKRVSAPATEVMAEILEKYAIELGERSVKISQHAGRKTVTDEDIKLAVK